MKGNTKDNIETHVYNNKYLNTNIRQETIKGPLVSHQILKLLRTNELKGLWVDSKFISTTLKKTPEQINMVLRSLRRENKVNFKYTKSKRSNKTLIVYKTKTQ